MATHYDLLQVASDASLTEIKIAYHKAARQFHPDRCQSQVDDEEFRRIQAAWECLRHADSRKVYDEQVRVQISQDNARRANATKLTAADCQGSEWIEDENVQVWVFTCRCGEELDLIPAEEDLVDCPGCSLAYDCRELNR